MKFDSNTKAGVSLHVKNHQKTIIDNKIKFTNLDFSYYYVHLIAENHLMQHFLLFLPSMLPINTVYEKIVKIVVPCGSAQL